MSKRPRSCEDDEAPTASRDDCQTASSPAKMIELEDHLTPDAHHTMKCLLPPHNPISLASAADFDLHYAKEHTNRCSSCGKNFPSAHYLALHIDENHNAMRAELAANGEKTYSCFVDDCDKKCSTPQKRRLHLIDKHMFPRLYDFRVVDKGIDKATSVLQRGQRRRLSTTKFGERSRRAIPLPTSNGDVRARPDGLLRSGSRHVDEAVTVDAREAVNELEKSFAALEFVPPSVQARQRHKKMPS